MVDISPFRAWRYDLSQVGDLADVTAPPYDVISPAEAERLRARHPENIAHVILPVSQPGDRSPDDRYARAGETLARWRHDGILVREHEESLYVYHQTFLRDGRPVTRRALLCRLRLEPFGTGHVFPHEETMSAPREDRLKLFRATKMNLSPVFGLFDDPGLAVTTLLEDACNGVTAWETTDDAGTRHRVWPITDPAVHGEVRRRLRESSVVIADGHHRYTTAINYQQELMAEGRLRDEFHPANHVLMALVASDDPGLTLRPTHRLITGLSGWTAEKMQAALSPTFEVDIVGTGPAAAKDTWDLVSAGGRQDVLGFGLATDQSWLIAELKDKSAMAAVTPEKSAEWRELAVSVLHELVCNDLLIKAGAGLFSFTYPHELKDAVDAVTHKTVDAAVLVPPATVEHVELIARQGETLPPKSTFFAPKLLTGLVLNALT